MGGLGQGDGAAPLVGAVAVTSAIDAAPSARRSAIGRRSPMCGRISRRSASHAMKNTLHTSKTRPDAALISVRTHGRWRAGATLAGKPGDEGETIRR
jgi:hypothetical protein